MNFYCSYIAKDKWRKLAGNEGCPISLQFVKYFIEGTQAFSYPNRTCTVQGILLSTFSWQECVRTSVSIPMQDIGRQDYGTTFKRSSPTTGLASTKWWSKPKNKAVIYTAATEQARRLEAVDLDQILLGQLVAHQKR